MTFNDFIYFFFSTQKTQTLETPETRYWKFDSKAALPQNVSQNFLSADHGKSKDKRDYLQTSAKSTLSTPLPKVGCQNF